MAPPPKRTQCAADALLDGPTLASKLAKNSAANAAATAALKQNKAPRNNGNPYTQKSQQLAMAGVTNTVGSSRKRSLNNIVRGRMNDSIASSRSSVSNNVNNANNAGQRAAANMGRTNATTTAYNSKPASRLPKTTNNNAASSAMQSAFERRHARDKVSKRVAPPTDTDKALLAMLDGPKKRKQKTMTNGTQNGMQQKRPSPSNSSFEKRQKMNPSGGSLGVMVAPPPMPSYSRSSSGKASSAATTKEIKPRKRVSSHTHYSKKYLKKEAAVGKKGRQEEHVDTNTTTMKRIDDGAGRVANGEDVQKDGNDGGSDSNGGLTIHHHGMDNRKDATPTSSGMQRKAFTENTTTTAMESTTISALDKGGQGGATVHNPYQRKIAVKSSVALKKDDGPLQSMERLEEGVNSVPGDGAISKSAVVTTAAARVEKINKVNEATTSPSVPGESVLLTKTACMNKFNKVNEATSLDATMPADEELMALPLLGIGAKRTAKSKSLHGKKFGVSSSGRSNTRRKGVAVDGRAAKESLEETLKDGAVHDSFTGETNDMQQGEVATSTDLSVVGKDDTSNELDNDTFHTKPYDDEEDDTNDTKASKHADWYDPEEHAAIQKEAALNNNTTNDSTTSSSRYTSKSKSSAGINDNFVRLDLRNGAGSCRGARNLKKVNKQKLWRAQHMFGKRDGGGGNGNGNIEAQGNGENNPTTGADMMGPPRYGKYAKRSTNTDKGGDLKCFASARSGGVDPLDDFVDGVFSKQDSGVVNHDNDKGEVTSGKKGTEGTSGKKKRAVSAPARDEGVPMCTRHTRPCKLLIVKRNNKGNKGRKFYVCCMPRGEQCDFFKWEEDTVEATQRALLKSSSSSGFIARQVAASKIRFKELTVPELRVEAKKRGLTATGKKDQILTRLLIWVRDEIANSVEEPNAPEKEEKVKLSAESKSSDAVEAKDGNDPSAEEETGDVLLKLLLYGDDDADNDGDDDDADEDNVGSLSDPEEECEEPTKEAAVDTTKLIELSDDDDDDASDNDEEPTKETAADKTKFIELSDDDESSYDDDDDASDDDESSYDELEICPKASNKKPTPKNSATITTTNSESPLHASLTNYFNYTTFREGQEWAIRRCFSHKKTLLVAPTGGGKSLCYALPAALMEGICLVVSPLISLMQDQLRQLPPKIPAATLSGSMTTAQMALIVDDVMRGRYKVLFVSPERLASAAFRRLVRPKFNVGSGKFERQFPTVSLLCVDEAHCLSQWGHNFRPSYLRVRSLLPLIEPKSILALTATAGPMVVRDICNTLCIPFDGHSVGGEVSLQSPAAPIEASTTLENDMDSDGVRILNCDRDNIDVFSLVLQNNDERRYLLHKILKEKKKGESERSKKLPIEEGCLSKGSVIIYVWRQKDTEIVAEQLNGAGIRGGVVCYHGGMDAGRRSRAQSKFMRGKARICVATVAFGLGINKPDIKGVIHLCLPPSPEHYLQEIGRAGRDGRAAMAIALPLVDEFVTRHSLAHSDRLSSNQLEIVFLSLKKLVNEALGDIPPEAGIDLDADRLFIDDIHVAMPVKQTVDASDCKEESIETIFSLLEEDNPSNPSLLSVEGYLPDAATITLKKRSLDKLEKMEQIALSISKCGTRVDGQNEQSNQDISNPHNKYQGNFGGTAMEKGFYAYSFGTYKFSVVRCARCMGPNTEPRHVYAALRRLQGNGELELVLDTTANGRAMHLRMKQDGIHLFRTKRGNNFGQVLEEIDVNDSLGAIVTKLSNQFSAKEKVSVGKVESMYEIMHQVSSCRQNDKEGGDMNEDEEDDSSSVSLQAKKSPRLVLFQKLAQNYFRNGSVDEETGASSGERTLPPTRAASNKAPVVIKDFQVRNMRLLTCLSSDVSLLMQMLALRRQEQMPMAVHIKEPKFADYRDLCLAKILHSIDAPRAPILEWYNHVLWGKYRSYSFSSIVQAVKKTFDNA